MTDLDYHRALPVSRSWDDDYDGPQRWRCEGCGAVTEWADELGDPDCPALSMFAKVRL